MAIQSTSERADQAHSRLMVMLRRPVPPALSMTGITPLTPIAHRVSEGAVTLVVDEEPQPVSRPATSARKQIRCKGLGTLVRNVQHQRLPPEITSASCVSASQLPCEFVDCRCRIVGTMYNRRGSVQDRQTKVLRPGYLISGCRRLSLG